MGRRVELDHDVISLSGRYTAYGSRICRCDAAAQSGFCSRGFEDVVTVHRENDPPNPFPGFLPRVSTDTL